MNSWSSARALVIVSIFCWVSCLSQAHSADGDWPTFGNDPGGSQYSHLAQIHRSNVSQLQQAWAYQSSDLQHFAVEGRPYALQSVPIHVNETLYFCTSFNRVIALDPASGKPRWVFDPHLATGSDSSPLITNDRRAGICRSVAYWQAASPLPNTPCQRRIFKGDVHGHVFAIDADTGKSCLDFGVQQGHPGYVTHADFDNKGTNDTARGMTSGPVIFEDLIIASSGARDSLTDANNGFVRAFDVRTGELRWSFDPIPEEAAHTTGAANVWSTMSVDIQRGLLFIPTTSPSPDFFGGKRKQDLPLTDAIVALDARTGKPIWHYQIVRHDLFDFDVPGHPLLVDILREDRKIPVAIQQTKQGRMFIFERYTGKSIFPIEDRAAPASDIPGELASPTQPFPVLPEAFSRQSLTAEDMWGLTPLDRAWCRREFSRLRYEGPFTPPSKSGSLIFPFGGGNWGGVAFDPVHNVVVAKGQNLALRVKLVDKNDQSPAATGTLADIDLVDTAYRAQIGLFVSPLGVPCTPPPFGTLTAIDVDTGKQRWQVPLGQATFKGITAPQALGWGSPNISGPMITAGGLVFIGAAMDAKLRAMDIETGDILWSHELPAPGMALPMTYESAGKQYVVIAAGGNSRVSDQIGDSIIAFSLP